MIVLFIVVGLVLLISSACSLFEAVLYSVPRSRVELLERAGRPSGLLLKQMLRQVDRPITAILSLNTIANTGGGAIAGAIAANVFGQSRVVYFSAAFTFGILVFSEVVPKTVGVVYSRALAPLIAHPLQALVVIFRPLIALTQLVTKLIWTGQHEPHVSDEEVLTMVGMGLRSGDFEPHEARIIQNVLSLERRTAGEVMTPRPVVFSLEAHATVQDAASNDELSEFSRIPVYDDDPDDLVGIVYSRDILKAAAADRFDVRLEALMRPIDFVVETALLDGLLRRFLERHQHMVAVVDEFGGLAGIVTLEDVLEELIGREIVDEFDQVTDLRAFAHRRREETLRKNGKMVEGG